MLVIISFRLDSTASLKLVHATSSVFNAAVHTAITQIQVSEVFCVGRHSIITTSSQMQAKERWGGGGGGESLDLPMTDSILTECRVLSDTDEFKYIFEIMTDTTNEIN